MAGSMIVSRESRHPGTVQTTRRARPVTKISCNRCRKPLSTTAYVCSCDCVFCEECTFEHFQTSASCPSCNKTLQESDIMECNVTDASVAAQAANAGYKSLFTKSNAALPHLSFVDMAGQLFKMYDTLKSGTRFLIRQSIKDSNFWAIRHHQTMRQLEGFKKENMKLKQDFTNARAETDQAIASLRERNAALERKLEEKDRQLAQFRQIHEGLTPESPRRSPATGSAGGGARRVSGDFHPPLKGVVMQKQASARAKKEAIAQSHSRRPVIGANPYNRDSRPSSATQSYMTPPVQMPQPGYASDGSETGRIRSLNSSSGFAFTSHGTQHMNKRRRTQPMSPSQAFAHGHSGGQTVARGPATYFQQPGHHRR